MVVIFYPSNTHDNDRIYDIKFPIIAGCPCKSGG